MVLLASCGTATNSNVSKAAGYASVIANGLAAAAPTVCQFAGMGSESCGHVTTAVADIKLVSTQLQAAASASAAQPLVGQLEADVNAIVAAAAQVKGLPDNVQLALQAAQVLLPPIEQVIGMVVTPPTAARAKAIPMSPDAAVCVLKQQAGQAC